MEHGAQWNIPCYLLIFLCKTADFCPVFYFVRYSL